MKSELENRIESHTEELRELLRIIPSDGPPTMGVDGETMRNRARETFTKVAHLLQALKGEVVDLEEQLAEREFDLKEAKGDVDRLDDLVEKVLDVERRIITGRELIDYVKERYRR